MAPPISSGKSSSSKHSSSSSTKKNNPLLTKHIKNPRVFFDIAIGNEKIGRIIFKLYKHICPRVAENFKCLCTGEKGIGKETKKPLHFKGTIFHRVVPGFIIQGGDFSDFNGRGGESIYGGYMEDENFTLKHSRAGLLSAANAGPNTIGSQFFITTAPELDYLDNKHVVFGRVIEGMNIVKQIEQVKTNEDNTPLEEVVVINCGELKLKKKQQNSDKKKKHSSSQEKHENPSTREEAGRVYRYDNYNNGYDNRYRPYGDNYYGSRNYSGSSGGGGRGDSSDYVRGRGSTKFNDFK